MKPLMRPYKTEEDYWRMREFLRHVFLLNDRLERSWHVARLDYARWHSCMNCAEVGLDEVVYLWEEGEELVGFVMPDGRRGEAHLLVLPHKRTLTLEEEMLRVAEECLPQVLEDNRKKISVWTPDQDHFRKEILHRHGYTKGDWPEYQWYRDLDLPIEAVPLASGYTIRSLGDGLELLERCYASGLGFHEGDIAVAVNNRKDVSWYRNIQSAALYRRDLDLVAIAPDGAIAAFCTIWFDDVTRSAYFEPVATVPDHQRRGLGKALLTEGLRRLKHMGATRAFVGGFSTAANALYKSVMGGKHEVYERWEKIW